MGKVREEELDSCRASGEPRPERCSRLSERKSSNGAAQKRSFLAPMSKSSSKKQDWRLQLSLSFARRSGRFAEQLKAYGALDELGCLVDQSY